MPAWSHLFTDTITISAESSLSAGGDPTFGAQTTLLGRAEFGTKKIRDAMGNTVESEALCITETAIARTSRVWLPGDDTGADGRKIIMQKSAKLPHTVDQLYETFF